MLPLLLLGCLQTTETAVWVQKAIGSTYAVVGHTHTHTHTHLDHQLGVEAVERGVSAVSKCPHRVVELPVLGYERRNLLSEASIPPILLALAVHILQPIIEL